MQNVYQIVKLCNALDYNGKNVYSVVYAKF